MSNYCSLHFENIGTEEKGDRFRKTSAMSKGQTARDGATCPEKKLARFL